jgi:hypothetical protein
MQAEMWWLWFEVSWGKVSEIPPQPIADSTHLSSQTTWDVEMGGLQFQASPRKKRLQDSHYKGKKLGMVVTVTLAIRNLK